MKVPTKIPVELNASAEEGEMNSLNSQDFIFHKHKCLFKVAYTYSFN